MYVSVCVYVWLHVSVYVCMYVSVYARARACVYIHNLLFYIYVLLQALTKPEIKGIIAQYHAIPSSYSYVVTIYNQTAPRFPVSCLHPANDASSRLTNKSILYAPLPAHGILFVPLLAHNILCSLTRVGIFK